MVYGSGSQGAVDKEAEVRQVNIVELISVEAFLVCRNFVPETVPLPTVFSVEALKALEQQTSGTLTLEALAHLVDGSKQTKDWDFIKAYVGGGDLE